MRVLLAIDGSASSDAARDLVASFDWPRETCVRVVSVVDVTSPALIGYSPYAMPYVDEHAVEAFLDASVVEVVDGLQAVGLRAERRLLHGRPGSLIVQEATEFGAELIVLGSRGMGRIESMLLGSVSAEVVDHAPCPVLVARSDTVDRILLATDGSATAGLAIDHLADRDYLARLPIEVVTVAPDVVARAPISAPEVGAEALRGYQLELDDARRQAEAIAAAAAARLLAEGRTARWSITVGDPAHEIIEAAERLHCSLVVLGSRGLTGLRRLFLGSVARNVLLHTTASVLIVREPVRERGPEGRRIVVGRPKRETAAAGVAIRAIRPGDATALQQFYADLSDDSRRARFLGWSSGLQPWQSRTFCTTDHQHREGFVATLPGPDGGDEEIVGHLCLEPDGDESAELAIAVADRLQRRGIGRGLMAAALDWARRTGTRQLTATAACANSGIFRLLQSLGLEARTTAARSGMCDLAIALQPDLAMAG
jgi:nucleotide-binding universal stress UspA family protein/GNAT superfamily N-acetyltransferase